MQITREKILNGCFIFWGAVTCPVWFGPLLCYVAYESDDYDENGTKIKSKISQPHEKSLINQIEWRGTNKAVPLPGKNIQSTSLPSGSRRNHLNCPICFHSDKDFQVINPCGHAICNDCSTKMIFQNIDNCPVCRSKIVSFIKLYLQ